MGPRDLAIQAGNFLDRVGAKYFVTGSMGAMLYGEVRMTADVDIVVDLKQGHIADVLREFSPPEFYVSIEAIREAMKHHAQFNVLHPASSMKIDFMIPEDTAYNRTRFARARMMQVAEAASVQVAAPEDIILKKLQYYREGGSDKHLRDIASMLRISPEVIDVGYIQRWAGPLGVSDEWAAARARVGV